MFFLQVLQVDLLADFQFTQVYTGLLFLPPDVMDAIFAFLTNLFHDRQLVKREVLCPKICEQRLDVHLLGFPNQQGLQALHIQGLASQDLVYLQELCGQH